MDTINAIAALQKSLKENGNLPLNIYMNVYAKYAVESINPCTQKDHLLVVAGERETE